MLLGILLIMSPALADDCPQQYNEHLYTELGCSPLYEGDFTSACPTSYDCSSYFRKDPNICHLFDSSYNVSDMVPQEETDSLCAANCVCKSNHPRPYLNCLNMECPEDFEDPLPSHCRRLYKEDKCCSTNTQCIDVEPPDQTCTYNQDTYIVGERFYDNEQCLTCHCSKGFTEKSINPICIPMQCGLELRHDQELRQYCAPVYHQSVHCCPLDWRCPNDVTVQQPISRQSSHSKTQCVFGQQLLNINDYLYLQDRNMECKCTLPPYLTCIYKK